jgi:hypothetical protein
MQVQVLQGSPIYGKENSHYEGSEGGSAAALSYL